MYFLYLFILLHNQTKLALKHSLAINKKNLSHPINHKNKNAPLWPHWRYLRAELQNLRRKAGMKPGACSLDRPPFIEATRACARCLGELGRIINRGAPCRACKLRVCKGCREFSSRTTDWVCLVCHKNMWVPDYWTFLFWINVW